MVLQVLHCPYCQGTDIVRHGMTRQGKQRYRCRRARERGRTFLLEYSYAGQSPDVKQQIVDMAMNAQRHSRYRAGAACEPHHSAERIKKKEPDSSK